MKKDNKGFSLVELMVAVIILALIVTPLLHSFLTVIRTNAKARRLLRSTTVAENVMEGLSGLSIETIALQFHLTDDKPESDSDEEGEGSPDAPEADPDDEDAGSPSAKPKFPYNPSEFIFLNMASTDSENPFDYGEILPVSSGGAVGPYYSSVDSGINDINVVTHQFKERNLPKSDLNNQKYYYYLQNVEEDRQLFDVRITLDASEYRTEEHEDGTITGQEYAYNEDLLVNIDRMDKKKDFIWIEPAEAKMLLVDQLKESYQLTIDRGEDGHGGQSLPPGHVEKNIETRYVVSIYADYNDKLDKEQYYVQFRLMAYCGCPFCNDENHSWGSVEKENGIQTKYEMSYDDIRNIYIFYYPNYGATSLDSVYVGDWRVAHSNPVNIYVIKQKNEQSTYANEISYQMKLEYFDTLLLYEPPEDISKSSCNNNIRSNLCTVQKQNADGTVDIEYKDQIVYFIGDSKNEEDYLLASSPDDTTAIKKFFGFDKNDPDPENPNPDTWVPTLTGETTNVNDYIYLKTVEVYPKGTFTDPAVLINKKGDLADPNAYVAVFDEAELENRRINVLTSRQ